MMKIAITEDRTIADIQQEFNHYFKFLKLEFFWGQGTKDEEHRIKNSELKMENIGTSMHTGSIPLSDDLTVANLENIFSNRFGLQVQVFRRSGGLWLETTKTDNWTLKVQNDHGREISELTRRAATI